MGKITNEVLAAKQDLMLAELRKMNGELEVTKIRAVRTERGLKDHNNNHGRQLVVMGIMVTVIVAVVNIFFKLMGG